jgi:hypothetical protein
MEYDLILRGNKARGQEVGVTEKERKLKTIFTQLKTFFFFT